MDGGRERKKEKRKSKKKRDEMIIKTKISSSAPRALPGRGQSEKLSASANISRKKKKRREQKRGKKKKNSFNVRTVRATFSRKG